MMIEITRDNCHAVSLPRMTRDLATTLGGRVTVRKYTYLKLTTHLVDLDGERVGKIHGSRSGGWTVEDYEGKIVATTAPCGKWDYAEQRYELNDMIAVVVMPWL